MKLLVVASDRREYQGILARAERPRRARVRADWARLVRMGEHELLLVANGAGAKRAAEAVDASLESFQPEAIVSAGFCGALSPELAVGDVVVGTAIAGAEGNYPGRPVDSRRAHHSGTICSIDHVAQSAEEKRRLGGGGAIAVEMEAAGVAGRAQALGLPFYCVRSVTDLAGETLANDFNSALRSDGHFDTMVILRRILHQPSLRLPELFRLRKRCAWASHTLGEFFADCRL